MGLSQLDAALGQASVSQDARTEHLGGEEVPLRNDSGAGRSATAQNHPLLCQACVSSPGHPSGWLKAGLGFGGLAASRGPALM